MNTTPTTVILLYDDKSRDIFTDMTLAIWKSWERQAHSFWYSYILHRWDGIFAPTSNITFATSLLCFVIKIAGNWSLSWQLAHLKTFNWKFKFIQHKIWMSLFLISFWFHLPGHIGLDKISSKCQSFPMDAPFLYLVIAWKTFFAALSKEIFVYWIVEKMVLWVWKFLKRAVWKINSLKGRINWI